MLDAEPEPDPQPLPTPERYESCPCDEDDLAAADRAWDGLATGRVPEAPPAALDPAVAHRLRLKVVPEQVPPTS